MGSCKFCAGFVWVGQPKFCHEKNSRNPPAGTPGFIASQILSMSGCTSAMTTPFSPTALRYRPVREDVDHPHIHRAVPSDGMHGPTQYRHLVVAEPTVEVFETLLGFSRLTICTANSSSLNVTFTSFLSFQMASLNGSYRKHVHTSCG